MASLLSDRIVIVTGAGGRLGRLIVRDLVAAGARVAALDREAPTGLPDAVLALAADVTQEPATVSAWDQVASTLGTPNALVHAVGMWGGAPLAETTLDAWRTVLDVNLTSAFLAFREAARRMTDGGRLVAVASGQGADRGVAEQAAYSAAKAGIVRLVEATAAEHADRGLTAVAVAPSTLLFGDEPAAAAGVSADDVAALCVRLCGPEGAVHTGATLRAYGSA